MPFSDPYHSRPGRRRRMPPADELHRTMDEWFTTALGEALLRSQQARLKPLAGRLFGQQALQLGCATHVSLLQQCPAAMRLCFAPSYEAGRDMPVADNAALPLQSECMDAVLIHHALDFAVDSHRLLREACRVTVPGGRLLIIGFNPVSLWGLGRLVRPRKAPWNGRFIAMHRLQDWLRLLDFQVEEIHYGGFMLPLNRGLMMRHANAWERFGLRYVQPLGGFYLVMARKQALPLTPVESRWPRLRRPLIGSPAVETGRMASHNRQNVIPLRWNTDNDGKD